MGKHNGKTDTKVLYKKSNITIRTHSRTCSDASQMAKSGIMQLKKTISKTNEYYTEGNKIKRDLSVETGFCILRRYYKSKHKRDKCSVPPSTIAKSKCSTVADTEMESGDEFKPDASACGDSRNKFEIANQCNPANIDITAMMVENLKVLLNDWIKKHVLEDTDTKKKLFNVLDSILQSLEAKISSTRSSCSTYIVERNGEGYKVRNKKTATSSITCQYCKQKQTSLITNRSSSVLFRKYSRFTFPFPYRYLRIISTLSIPRNLHRKDKKKAKEVAYKYKKSTKKNRDACNKKEKKVVINVSSCDTSPASKNSIVKCSKANEKNTQIIKRGVIFVPKMIYKSTTEYTSTTEVEEAHANNKDNKHIHLNAMPSILKSIYVDDPANVTSTDKIPNLLNTNDNFTMTEAYYPSVKVGNSISNVRFHEASNDCCKQNTTSKTTHKSYEVHSNYDYINQSIGFPNITVPRRKNSDHSTKIHSDKSHICNLEKHVKVPSYRRSHRRKTNPRFKYSNIKRKNFTYLYEKTKSKNQQEKEFLNHFHNVFKYVTNYGSKRNIKLEIHCNVYPMFDAEEKKTNVNNNEILNLVQTKPAEGCDMVSLKGNDAIDCRDTTNNRDTEVILGPEIIPLLDGTVSQAKYIFKSDNSINKSEDTVKTQESKDQGTITTGAELAKEYSGIPNKFEELLKYKDSIDEGTAMTGLEVSKELNELKIAIRDLSATAEMIVSEHIKREAGEKHSNNISNNMTETKLDLEITNDNLSKRSTQSKGIQISNTATKGQPLSGIKLSKEPKRLEEFTNRLKKRSSSYHVIESESILKVTDMTSGIKSKLMNPPQIKKSKSLLQLTNDDQKQRLMAFFCDHCRKNDEIICNIANRRGVIPINSFQPICPSRSNGSLKNKAYIPVKISQESYQDCSSAFIDIEKPTITVKKRSAMPFWEGCLYCILLWIPLAIIIYLFYDFVLKDLINKPTLTSLSNSGTKKVAFFATTSSKAPLIIHDSNDTKSSRFLLKLTDLGF